MPKILIIANESEQIRKLSSELAQRGFSCLVIASEAKQSHKITEHIAEQSPSLVLADMTGSSVGSELWELPQRVKEEKHIPIIALVTKDMLDNLGSNPSIDDFIVNPWDSSEVIARIRRVLKQTNTLDSEDIIKCGDLVMDIPRCQVSLSNRPITLTFKEYQLLKFLASNQGKVFTREVLLDKVWGWDYYGGDRTVDVHIRRLRSKIEDKNHFFIETVRNIGYKFAEGK
jgi:Response regulators consisting of a CheY-like receiver domain and a winged-helix DNA-binding domain